MSFEKLKSVFVTNGEHLGDLVWWALSEAEVPRVRLETLWRSAGLDPSFLPEPTTAEKALKLAVRTAQLGKSDHLIRLGKESEDELVFAIVEEQRHQDGSVSFTQHARVVLDRKAETVTSDNPTHSLVGCIAAEFARVRSMQTSDDVRRAMLRTLNACSAVSLREHGGIYWVPAPHANLLRKLQSCIEQLGRSQLYLLPVHRCAESERTLGEVAKASIEDELLQLQAQMVEFKNAPPTRATTLVKRLECFDALRAKAQLYRDILHVQVTDIDTQLAELTQEVEVMLIEKAAA